MRWVCLLLLGACCNSLVAEESTVAMPSVHVDNIFGDESPWLKVVESEGKATIVMKEPRDQEATLYSVTIATASVSDDGKDHSPWGGALILNSDSRPPFRKDVSPSGGIDILSITR
jgi:hypothetical protein